MTNKKEAILSLLKNMEPTLNAGGFRVDVPEGTAKGELPVYRSKGEEYILLKSGAGMFKIVFSGAKASVCCSPETTSDPKDLTFKTVTEMLFDPDHEDYGPKDIRSLSNDFCQAVEKFYEYSSSDAIKPRVQTASANADDIQKKKKNKFSEISYEPVNLAFRICNIYPQIKDEIDANIDRYGSFLGDEFFDSVASPVIMDSIRHNDVKTMKKVFATLNMFYEEGPKDTQSLIAVTILGRNFEKEPGLMTICADQMDANLGPQVIQIVKYLSKGTSKRRLKAFDNPKPETAKIKK